MNGAGCVNGAGRISPGGTERGLAVGTTGCGKSTLAEQLLRPHEYVVVIDPKHSFGDTYSRGHLPGYTLVETPDELEHYGNGGCPKLQYRPLVGEHDTADEYNRVYWYLFARRNTFIYTDEVFLIQRGLYIPDGMRACITAGRQRGIGMLHGAQRPAGIDRRLLTESEHFYVFELRSEDDRKRMAEMMPRTVVDEPAQGHNFYYQGPGANLQYLRLQLTDK